MVLHDTIPLLPFVDVRTEELTAQRRLALSSRCSDVCSLPTSDNPSLAGYELVDVSSLFLIRIVVFEFNADFRMRPVVSQR
jgi:hypothetical protein